MADPTDSIDITTDLNGQAPDAQPFHGDDLPQNAPVPQTVEPPAKEGGDKSEPSIRDLLSDAFKGGEAPKTDGAQAPAAPAGDVPELVKVGERYHRRDGSFASREDIAAFEAGQVAPGTPPPLPQWADHLTALERDQFAKLPKETRSWIEQTMEGVSQQSNQFQEYGMLEQILAPRRNAWASEGLTAPVALNQLFALSDFAGRDPAEFVLWFSDLHRLDLDAILDARDAANAGGESNPQLTGLQQEIVQLRNTINGFSNQTTQQQQARNLQVVQQFIAETDAEGKPLYPYFNDLGSEISANISAIRQQQPYLPERDVLKAAYEFATYNNPSIRDRMQQQQARAMQEKAAADAARARQIGVSVNGGPAGDTSQLPNNANRTLREELLDAYRQQQAGV